MKPSLGVKIMKISDVLVENLEVGDKKAEPRLLPLFYRLLSHLSLYKKLPRLCTFCNLYSHLIQNANYIFKSTQDHHAKGDNLNIHKGRDEGHHPPYFAPSDIKIQKRCCKQLCNLLKKSRIAPNQSPTTMRTTVTSLGRTTVPGERRLKASQQSVY